MFHGRKGFTLIELLIVLGIIGIISIVVLTMLAGRQSRAGLDSTTRQIVALLREAQSRSFSQEDGASWGVHFDNPVSGAPFYALFRGSYAATNVVVGQSLASSVRYSTLSIPLGGALDVIFSKVTGLPLSAVSISLELTAGARDDPTVLAVSTIAVDLTGLVSF